MSGTKTQSPVGAIAVLATLVFGASCDLSQSPAACQQIDIAACALRDHCGGVDASTCEAGRADPHLFGCGTTSEDAATCIEAINAIIAGECSSIPLDLPCPNTILGLAGEACAADEECSGGLPCQNGSCGNPADGDGGIPGCFDNASNSEVTVGQFCSLNIETSTTPVCVQRASNDSVSCLLPCTECNDFDRTPCETGDPCVTGVLGNPTQVGCLKQCSSSCGVCQGGECYWITEEDGGGDDGADGQSYTCNE